MIAGSTLGLTDCHPGADSRVVEQCEQRTVVGREVADHPILVERGPGIVLIVVGQPEGVQQLVVGAVEKNIFAFVDDDE